MNAQKKSTIFISRSLDADSPFRKILASKATVIGLSLIEFAPIPFEKLPEADWLFFYSQKGIHYCLSQLEQKDHLPAIGVIGQASANFLTANYALQPQFIGTGDPMETAQQFLPLVRGKKVIFAQAQQSKQSVQKLLGTAIQALDLITYTNAIKTDFELPMVDILVFTSPLNVQAYFSKYPYQNHQKVISIGKVTAQALTNYNIPKVSIATAPNEQALAAACCSKI